MLRLDLEKVKANVARATTEDLLDRATVYRAGMEPAALDVIEGELRRRGVSAAEIEAHAEREGRRTVTGPEGRAVKCSRCGRPAVAVEWGWHRLWGVLPVFPRRLAYCAEHQPDGKPGG
jgi:hypothetical protein